MLLPGAEEQILVLQICLFQEMCQEGGCGIKAQTAQVKRIILIKIRGRKIEQEGRENEKKNEIQHKQEAERPDFHAAVDHRVYHLFRRADQKYHPLFFQ